jgi:hypothetical protein
MTRDQKENVLELYQQGRTVRHIAQLTHEIGAITNAYKQEIEQENFQLEEKDDIKSKSKTILTDSRIYISSRIRSKNLSILL